MDHESPIPDQTGGDGTHQVTLAGQLEAHAPAPQADAELQNRAWIMSNGLCNAGPFAGRF